MKLLPDVGWGPSEERQRRWEGMLEVEGERAIIYELGKRRWAVPARFPQLRERQTRMRKHQQVNYKN